MQRRSRLAARLDVKPARLAVGMGGQLVATPRRSRPPRSMAVFLKQADLRGTIQLSILLLQLHVGQRTCAESERDGKV
jgi:hypothetical protein